jgi:hypothetical protein
MHDTKSPLENPFSFLVVETFHRNVSALVGQIAEKGEMKPGFGMTFETGSSAGYL